MMGFPCCRSLCTRCSSSTIDISNVMRRGIALDWDLEFGCYGKNCVVGDNVLAPDVKRDLWLQGKVA